MRATEFFDWLTRTDIGMGVNPKKTDYTHFVPRLKHKRMRYLYQCWLRGKKPVK